MKQFLTVLKFELNNYFKNKSFLLTTIILIVLAVGIIALPDHHGGRRRILRLRGERCGNGREFRWGLRGDCSTFG